MGSTVQPSNREIEMSHTTDLASVEILFDNGGGITLQTEGYAHYYDDPAQAAHDYKVIADGGDTSDWDGNDGDAEVTNYSGYRFYDHAEISAIIADGKHETSWGNERAFFSALGMTFED